MGSDVRLVVAGSRTFTDRDVIRWALAQSYRACVAKGASSVTLVSGEAPGADRLARYEWEQRGLPVQKEFADWDRHGKSAGFLRNTRMVSLSAVVGVVAFMQGYTPGTADTVTKAVDRGIPVWLFASRCGVQQAPIVVTRENLSAVMATLKSDPLPEEAEADTMGYVAAAVATATRTKASMGVKARTFHDRQQGISRCGRCGEDVSSPLHEARGGGWVACSAPDTDLTSEG